MDNTDNNPNDNNFDEYVIIVSDGGIIESLHTDAIPLHSLGVVEAERASDVEFDFEKQKWIAIEAKTGHIIAENVSRDACIAEERRYFNKKLKGGLRPFEQ